MLSTLLFTSESVTEGHPGKVCDTRRRGRAGFGGRDSRLLRHGFDNLGNPAGRLAVQRKVGPRGPGVRHTSGS